MTFTRALTLSVALMLCVAAQARENTLFPPGPGFTLPDSVGEFSLTYMTVDHLIVLPFVINDTVQVNLILDTGCQTLILFGKRYEKVLDVVPDFRVAFSGMGSGKPAVGKVSLRNKVSMGPVKGVQIPIVVVPGKRILRHHMKVDGLIGYDIFTRFEIEVHPIRQEIVFRPAFNRTLPCDYNFIPLSLAHHRPTIAATLTFSQSDISSEMLVDTGSTLSVLVKSSDKERLTREGKPEILGMGINGIIEGARTVAGRLLLHDYVATDVPAAVTYSPWHDYSSIGMGFLKDYSVIINFVQGYMGLRPPAQPLAPGEIL